MSKAEAIGRTLESLRKIVERDGCSSLPTHFFGVRVQSLSIKNDSQLAGGDNIGCATGIDGGSAEAPSIGDDDDGGDGDSDPDPDLKKRTRPVKHHTAANARLDLPSEGFVRLPQVLAAYPISKSSWWAGCKSGRYPKPVKLGPRTTAWRASDIRALIEAQGGQ